MTKEDLSAIEARAKAAGAKHYPPHVEEGWTEELRIVRSDIPALVAEVRALRERVAELDADAEDAAYREMERDD